MKDVVRVAVALVAGRFGIGDRGISRARRVVAVYGGLLIAVIFIAFVSRGGMRASAMSESGAPSDTIYLPLVYGPPIPTPIPTNTSVPTSTMLPTNTPFPTSTNTPAPSGVQVERVSQYTDSVGYSHVVGEIANYTSQPIYGAQVGVTYYTASGLVAGSNTWFTVTEMILPGERSPFDDLQNPQTGWTRYTISLNGYETSFFINFSHAFSFSGQNQYFDGYAEHYTGQITNQSGVTLKYPEVVITGYGSDSYGTVGKVVFVDFTFATGGSTIVPGATQAYDIIVLPNRFSLATSTHFIAEGSQ